MPGTGAAGPATSGTGAAGPATSGTGAAGPATSGRDTVLVLNSGSSSLKYQLVQPDTGVSLAHGIVERIGQDGGVPDHEASSSSGSSSITCVVEMSVRLSSP